MSVILLALEKLALQREPQFIPEGELVIRPLPRLVTLNIFKGLGESEGSEGFGDKGGSVPKE